MCYINVIYVHAKKYILKVIDMVVFVYWCVYQILYHVYAILT